MSENKTIILTPQNNSYPSLKFTGNWFIDAGILGFVNLMEEVYGWDLNELRDRINKESEIVYYGYFPFAYFYNLSQKGKEKLKTEVTNFIEQNNNLGKGILEEVWWKYIVELFREKWIKKKLEVKRESKCYNRRKNPIPHYTDTKYRGLIKGREDAINDLIINRNFKESIPKILGKRKAITIDNFSIEDLEIIKGKLNALSKDKNFFEKVNKVIEKNRELKSYLNEFWDKVKMKNITKENYVFCRIPVDNSFFKNYLFFNNSSGIFKQLEDLRNLLDGNTKYSEYLSKIDRVISKFLPSDKEFTNISYTEFRTEMLVRNVPYLFVYLINFLNAFTSVSNIGSVFFYSSDLGFTYRVNKRIKMYLAENSKDNDLTILRVTLQSVIDTIIEVESIWSFENMYLIRYEKLSQQDLIGVEYLGIPKLQASIILDDILRNVLNKRIPVVAFRLNGKVIIEKWSWVLDEFIKNNSLLSVFYRNLWLYLNSTINNFSVKSFIYISSIDRNITDLREKNKGEIFSNEFFYKYKNIVNNIKEFAERLFSISYMISSTFTNFPNDKRHDLAYALFIRLRKGQKYAFVNILLKELIHVVSKESIENIIRFLFQEVLNNDKTWQNSAVAIISGLIYRGGEDEETDNEL